MPVQAFFEGAPIQAFDGTAHLDACKKDVSDDNCAASLFLYPGVVVSAANVGTPIVVDAASPGWAGHTRALSNGRRTLICTKFFLRPFLPQAGVCQYEAAQWLLGSAAIAGALDWQGFRIDELHLTLLSFQIAPYFDPEFGPGVRFTSHVRYEVHGEALPPACQDGLDDDLDGLVDLADPGCSDPSDVSENDPSLPCDDGVDGDGDGLVDVEEDPGCRDAVFPIENPQCQDGLNNDNRFGVDFDGGVSATGEWPDDPDPDCSVPWKNKEAAPSCGLGLELALLLAPLAALRARRRTHSASGTDAVR
jgi:hypothetical protein